MALQRRLGQLDAVQPFLGGQLRQEHDKGGARADDNGIDKHAEHLNHALRHRMFDIGRRRRVRCRTLAGFVGIQAALDAQHHGLRHQTAQQPAAGRLEGKGVAENQREHLGNTLNMNRHHIQSHQKIEHRHQRHKTFRHLGHAADAAENNRRRHQHQAGGQKLLVLRPLRFGRALLRRPAGSRLHRQHNGVGLNRVVNQPEADNQAQRKQHAQPLLPQALADVIGRAAAKLAGFLVAHLKQLRQRRFGKGRTHAD